MNRKRKINAILKSKLKKKNAKLSTVVKPKYVSKAERERIALEEQAATQSGSSLDSSLEREQSQE